MLLAVIWVVISGFMANLLLTQYIEQGPQVVATLSQFIPSFALFRGGAGARAGGNWDC